MSTPRIFLFSILFLLSSMPALAQGGVSYFTSRSDFDASCDVLLATEDFTGSGLAPSRVFGCASPVNSVNANCFPAGVLMPGFNISGDGNFNKTGDVLIATAGFFGLPQDAIGGNEITEPFNIAFDAPVTSVAFNLFSVLGISDILLETLDDNGNTIDSKTLMNASLTATFVGLTSSTPIRGIRLKSQDNKLEFINNLSFGSCGNTTSSDIPTMSQWSMFILGLILTSLAVVRIREYSISDVIAEV